MSLRLEKLKVLVVEDTLPMRQLIQTVLEALGVGKIFIANEGGHAMEILKLQNPDIVITDWHMEPVDGLELLTFIRKDPRSPNKMLPVIIMTGYSAIPRVVKARDMGATEFIVKPFSADDLLKRIAHVINHPRDFVKSGEFFGPDRRRRKMENYKGPKRRTIDKKEK